MPNGGPAHILALRIANAEAELAVLAFDQLNGALARFLALGKGVGGSRSQEHDRPRQDHRSHKLLHDVRPPKRDVLPLLRKRPETCSEIVSRGPGGATGPRSLHFLKTPRLPRADGHSE